MEPGILNQTVLLFKQSSLIWAPTIGNIMEPTLITLMVLGWTLAMLAEVWAPGIHMIGTMMRFLLASGFALAMVQIGYTWVDDVFTGVGTVAQMLGIPAFNPSAVMSYGAVVAEPITASLANSGMLSYIRNPMTWFYGLAALAVQLVFVVLAFQLTGALILSYVLTAMTPFAWAFFGTDYTRPLTFLHIRMCFGCIAALFVLALITAITSELGAIMEQQLRTQFSAPGVVYGWADYALPLSVSIVLICVFVWLPASIARSAYGFIPDWSGGVRAAAITGGAISGGMQMISNAGSMGQSAVGSMSRGAATAKAYVSAGGGGGGQLGASPWGKKP